MATKKAGPAIDVARLQKVRVNFTKLLAANPNYFGTLKGYPLKAVLPVQGNETFERLTCVGFNPDLDLLEATVQILRPTGYNGDLCHAGSTEFVRFYVDYGGGWQDAGLAAFKAHDIPNFNDCAKQSTKPLTYAVTLPHDPTRGPCFRPTMPRVRAILSWQSAPPAGQPNWTQVWGNTLDRNVFVKPRPRRLVELFPQDFELPIDLVYLKDEPIPLPDPPPDFSVAELAAMYAPEATRKATKSAKAKLSTPMVEPHRFGLADIEAAYLADAVDESVVTAKVLDWQKLELDWVGAVTALEKTSGDTTYEEIDCVGLDYNREWLVANFTVKRPSGYNGTPCRGGSYEYVAFWADYDDSCTWTYVGTAQVKVHDVAGIPPDGLHYWVGVRAGTEEHRRSCEQPKIARIRAVLSWNSPPSTTDPDLVPHWGNRRDVHVEVKPGEPIGLDPEIRYLGGVAVGNIDAVSGRTLPGAALVYRGGAPVAPGCPFGGRVDVQTPIPAAFAAAGHRYRLVVLNTTTLATTPVTAPFQVFMGTTATWRTPAADGWLPYIDPALNDADLLGMWRTANLGTPDRDHLWAIRLEMETSTGTFLGQTPWHRIQLDNTAPDVAIEIAAGGDCKDFDQGVPVTGTFIARDANFGVWRLLTLPTSLGPNNPTSATPTTSQTSPAGDQWSLATAGMQPCGYVIQLEAWDTSIVDSGERNNYNRDDVGFCLRAPGT